MALDTSISTWDSVCVAKCRAILRWCHVSHRFKSCSNSFLRVPLFACASGLQRKLQGVEYTATYAAHTRGNGGWEWRAGSPPERRLVCYGRESGRPSSNGAFLAAALLSLAADVLMIHNLACLLCLACLWRVVSATPAPRLTWCAYLSS